MIINSETNISEQMKMALCAEQNRMLPFYFSYQFENTKLTINLFKGRELPEGCMKSLDFSDETQYGERYFVQKQTVEIPFESKCCLSFWELGQSGFHLFFENGVGTVFLTTIYLNKIGETFCVLKHTFENMLPFVHSEIINYAYTHFLTHNGKTVYDYEFSLEEKGFKKQQIQLSSHRVGRNYKTPLETQGFIWCVFPYAYFIHDHSIDFVYKDKENVLQKQVLIFGDKTVYRVIISKQRLGFIFDEKLKDALESQLDDECKCWYKPDENGQLVQVEI